jgi:hypothetical protein
MAMIHHQSIRAPAYLATLAFTHDRGFFSGQAVRFLASIILDALTAPVGTLPDLTMPDGALFPEPDLSAFGANASFSFVKSLLDGTLSIYNGQQAGVGT